MALAYPRKLRLRPIRLPGCLQYDRHHEVRASLRQATIAAWQSQTGKIQAALTGRCPPIRSLQFWRRAGCSQDLWRVDRRRGARVNCPCKVARIHLGSLRFASSQAKGEAGAARRANDLGRSGRHTQVGASRATQRAPASLASPAQSSFGISVPHTGSCAPGGAGPL